MGRVAFIILFLGCGVAIHQLQFRAALPDAHLDGPEVHVEGQDLVIAENFEELFRVSLIQLYFG